MVRVNTIEEVKLEKKILDLLEELIFRVGMGNPRLTWYPSFTKLFSPD